jgi:hypothetical protein
MKASAVGQAGLRGWRGSVANAVAPSVAKRSGLSEDQARAAIGAIFLLLSLLYIIKAFKDLAPDRSA